MRDDLISRQAAIDALRVAYWDRKIQSAKDDPCIVDAMTDWAIRQVKALPPVEPERKRGRWVPGRKIGKEILTDGSIVDDHEDYRCSSCGLIIYRILHNIDGTPFYKFCPNCGADMRG